MTRDSHTRALSLKRAIINREPPSSLRRFLGPRRAHTHTHNRSRPVQRGLRHTFLKLSDGSEGPTRPSLLLSVVACVCQTATLEPRRPFSPKRRNHSSITRIGVTYVCVCVWRKRGDKRRWSMQTHIHARLQHLQAITNHRSEARVISAGVSRSFPASNEYQQSTGARPPRTRRRECKKEHS